MLFDAKLKNNTLHIIFDYERFSEIRIPFFFIFKIFGIEDENQMLKYILQTDIYDERSKNLKEKILLAMNASY